MRNISLTLPPKVFLFFPLFVSISTWGQFVPM
jgi:hypothetical protein